MLSVPCLWYQFGDMQVCEVCDYVRTVCRTVANSLNLSVAISMHACVRVCMRERERDRESACWSIPIPIFCPMLQLPQPSELDQFWIDFNFGGQSMSTYIEDSWEGSASSSTEVCTHSARQNPIHVNVGRIPTILASCYSLSNLSSRRLLGSVWW